MLDFDDIQHILLTRAPALTGRYEFLSFRNAAGGRAWLSGIAEKVHSAAAMKASVDQDKRWVTVAFTWNGLRALGVDEASLATFPEEFKQGMVARAQMLGDTGANYPDNWVGGLASPDLHAIAILFARDAEERGRCQGEHQKLLAQCEGVDVLSTLNLEATPPFDYAHDHFGYRDRISQPVIEGAGEEPTPGSGAPLKAGEFILGYPDENGPPAGFPQPEILSRNGSFMAYRRLQEHVGRFREFLHEHGKTPEEQELIAAKLMGRWRSGAPLVLAPDKDNDALGADSQRNNDFNYKQMDPHGYAVPLGAHIRRMNPRDTAHNMNRRRMIRRGATYGPALPEGAAEDGIERE
jgi:deferrochelatase/peroxidase EfeB